MLHSSNMFKWSLSSSPDDHCTNHMRSIVGCFSHDATALTWLQRSKWGFDHWGLLGIPSRWERISSACIPTNNLHCWALQSLGVVDLSGMEYLHGGFNGVQKDFKTFQNYEGQLWPQLSTFDGIQRKTAKTHSNVTTLASLRWSTPKWTWPCL